MTKWTDQGGLQSRRVLSDGRGNKVARHQVPREDTWGRTGGAGGVTGLEGRGGRVHAEWTREQEAGGVGMDRGGTWAMGARMHDGWGPKSGGGGGGLKAARRRHMARFILSYSWGGFAKWGAVDGARSGRRSAAACAARAGCRVPRVKRSALTTGSRSHSRSRSRSRRCRPRAWWS